MRARLCSLGARMSFEHGFSKQSVHRGWGTRRCHGHPRCAGCCRLRVAIHLDAQPVVQSAAPPVLTIGGRQFRDLNRNGVLDPYEDWRLTSAVRAADLVGRMTLEEKAGAAVHGTAPIAGGPLASGPAYDSASALAMILARNVNSLITRMAVAPRELAKQNNRLQAIAERGRLGIPVTISSDPRSHFQTVGGASVQTSGFSRWPETLGLPTCRACRGAPHTSSGTAWRRS